MLKSAHIQNIQNIKDEKFEFSEGINIISGESTNGKSASFRSFTLAISNSPSAYEYKPHNLERGGISRSILTFDNCIVERRRSASLNQYICDKYDKPLEAFGNNVPPQLEKLMGIPDYLIQGQHDPYFLLNDSSGEVARKINKVCDLEIIDKSQSKIDSIVTKSKSDLGYSKETLKEKNLELEDLNFVEDFELKIQEINSLLKESDKIDGDTEKINIVLSLIEDLDEEIKTINNKLKFEKEIKNVLQLISDCVKIDNDCNKIEGLSNNIEDLESQIKTIKYKLRFDEDIKTLISDIKEYDKEESKLNKIEYSIETIEENEQSSSNKLNFAETIKSLQKDIEEYLKENKMIRDLELFVENIETLEDELEEIKEKSVLAQEKITEYKETLGECPFCGNEL